MIVLFYLLVGAAIIVFQTTLTEYFSVWMGVRPDAMLLATLYLGLHRGREPGLIGGFLFGLLQDALTGGLLGANALSKGLIGHATGNLRRNIVSRNALFQSGVGLFATLFDVGLSAGLAFVFLPDLPMPETYWWEGAKSAVLNMALAPVVIGLLGRAQARTTPPTGGVPYPDVI